MLNTIVLGPTFVWYRAFSLLYAIEWQSWRRNAIRVNWIAFVIKLIRLLNPEFVARARATFELKFELSAILCKSGVAFRQSSTVVDS